MGILFGKKKAGGSSTPIHKSQRGTTAPRTASVLANENRNPNNENISPRTAGQTSGKSFSPSTGRAKVGGAPPSGQSPPGGHPRHLASSNMAGSAGGTGLSGTTLGNDNPMSSTSPIERVVNLYGLSITIFNLTRAILTVQDWKDPLFMEYLDSVLLDLDREMRVLHNPQALRDWAQPLHYRKTGAVIGAGRRITIAHKGITDITEKLKKSPGNFGPNEQRQYKEAVKEMIGTYIQLCSMVEMVVPADFNGEINELARTMRDLVDTASGKLNFIFDDVARICTTSSVRLCHLALWKGLQVSNVGWVRQVNDTCFTVCKASKVLYVIGQKLYENMTDRSSYDNLTTLTRGVVVQIKKLQEMAQVEPPNHTNVVITFTNEIIYEHLMAYDVAIKEVSSSLSNYINNSVHGGDIAVNLITKILSELEVVKNSVKNPDITSLVNAVTSISESLEKFCASVYHLLHVLGDQYEVIKEQIMETMQLALHACTQLQLVVVTKSLYHNIINPESTMLIAVRTLLLSVSIVMDSVDSLKQADLIVVEGGNEDEALGPAEINEAIVYILHYGRPLYRGEGTQDQLEEDTGQEGPDTLDIHMTTTTTITTHPSPIPSNSVLDGLESMGDSDDDSRPKYGSGNISPKFSEKNYGTKNDYTSPSVPVRNAAPVVANKNWIDMTTEEFKAYCNAHGKPNPDTFSDKNLPPNFDPPPQKAVFKDGGTREEYKAYMVAKYEYETWENKLILFKIKLKKKLDDIN